MPKYNYEKAVARSQYLWLTATNPTEKQIGDQIGYPSKTIAAWRREFGWDLMRAAKHFDDLVAVYRALGVDPEVTGIQILRGIRQIIEICDRALENERKAYDPRTKVASDALSLMSRCWELNKKVMESVPHEKLREAVAEILRRENERLLDYEEAQKRLIEF